jgi:GMP synthase (glutamine-hydrolysing)
MLEPGAPKKALIILHQAHSTPGRVGRWLRQAGYELDIRRPSLGDALPQTLREHAGVVVFGGPMSANDPDDWIRKEIEWLATPLAEEKPFLGLCLGAQMLAKQLGARVFNHDDRRCKAGYYQVHPTAAGDALCSAKFPRHAYHWHGDGFELPRGALLLAQGCQNFPYQAFRYGRGALALQFHPEVTYQMMCRWTTRGAERLLRPGARPPQEHLNGWYLYDRAVGHWLDRLLSCWIQDALPPVEKAAPPVGAAHRTSLTLAAACPEL